MENKQSAKDVLTQMQEDFINQKNALMKTVEKNDNKIAEIDRYLESLFEKEDRDFKVFSPRNVESIYKDKIQNEKEQKKLIENDNHNLYKKIAFFMDKIEKLNKVLSKEEELEEMEIKKPIVKSASSILDVQEKERQRIARDLHDTVVQNLVHIIHKIDLSSKYLDQDTIRAKLELISVTNYIKETVEELRNTIFDLRPMEIDDLEFQTALERLMLQLKQKTDNTLKIDFEVDVSRDINNILLIGLYRIIQECCINVIKHAKAKELLVKIREEDKNILLEVIDDGIGFDYEKVKEKQNSFGLAMTEERVSFLSGVINIDSKKNKGTSIVIEIPKG